VRKKWLEELTGRLVRHQVVGDLAVVVVTAKELGELLTFVKKAEDEIAALKKELAELKWMREGLEK